MWIQVNILFQYLAPISYNQNYWRQDICDKIAFSTVLNCLLMSSPCLYFFTVWFYFPYSVVYFGFLFIFVVHLKKKCKKYKIQIYDHDKLMLPIEVSYARNFIRTFIFILFLSSKRNLSTIAIITISSVLYTWKCIPKWDSLGAAAAAASTNTKTKNKIK